MFQQHRKAFLEGMEAGDLALFPGAGLVTRNHDIEFPFRQESGFYYLTGFQEPDAILMLAREVPGLPAATLFVLPRDRERETWTGRRMGPEGVREKLGFEAAAPVDEAEAALLAALPKARRLWYRLGDHVALDKLVLSGLSDLRKKVRLGLAPPSTLLDPGVLLHELRLFKSREEVDWMRRAAAVSAEAHLLAMALAAPGVWEYEMEALLHYVFRRHGGEGWSYPSIVAGGPNACILHYSTNHCRLRDGDLVLVDAGAEFRTYAADITRTYPVQGRFSPVQRDVYQIVLEAQKTAIEKVAPGTAFHDVHAVALRRLCEGLRELGVLKASLGEILEKKLYKDWYMHNTSHWIGLDVHDAGPYYKEGKSRPLEEGMCLTVEPGLYFPPDDERLPEALRGIGIRIEDDILVTGGGRENLTVATPKEVADVEAACAAERVMPPTLDTELVNR